MVQVNETTQTNEILWTLTCGRYSIGAIERQAKRAEFEARVGVTMAEARKVAHKDRSGILNCYVSPGPARYVHGDLYVENPRCLWVRVGSQINPWVYKGFLNTLGGLVVKMKDGRVYLILRSALKMDPYWLTRTVYQIAKIPDVKFVDRIRGASYERDASIIRTPGEFYAWLATPGPGALPEAPTPPALMLAEHLLRELEEFAEMQIDLMRKQFVNLEYLWNIRARRLAARMKHQLEAELQVIRNRLKQYETEFKNTAKQAKVAAETAKVDPNYVGKLEDYVNSAKAKIQARVEELSKEIQKMVEKIMGITETTTRQEPPPHAPQRLHEWPKGATPTVETKGGTVPVSSMLSDPKMILLGAGGIAALWYFLRR